MIRAFITCLLAPALAVAITSSPGGGTAESPAFVNPSPELLNACSGDTPGLSCVRKFGRNEAVGTGAPEVIQSENGAYLGFLQGGTTVRVKAGNAADTALGVGCREVSIEGVVSGTCAWTRVSLATAGASPSASTTATFMRVNRLRCTKAGTYHSNSTADVDVETTGGVFLARLDAGSGSSEAAMWTCPRIDKAGRTVKACYINAWAVTVESSKTANVELTTSQDICTVVAPFGARQRIFYRGNAFGTVAQVLAIWPSIEPGTDIWWEAQANVSASIISAQFGIVVDAR